jgi:C-terminal processing protease CtpA/Prc
MIQTGPGGDGSAHLLLRADRDRKTLSIQRLREGAPGPGTGWQRFSIDLMVPPRADSVAIGLYVTGTIDAWFDDMRVTTWGEEDLSPPAPEVARYTEEVLDLMENRSVRREAIDWSRLRDEVQRMLLGAKTTADAYPAITFAVRLLDDDHSAFITPAQLQRMMPKLKGRVSASPDSEISAEAVRGEILSSSGEDTLPIGYVFLPAFGGASTDLQQAYADSVVAALGRVQDSEPCGWVVDARSFSGGNMWPALAGLGPLLGEGTVLHLVNPDSTIRDVVYRNGRIELAGAPVLRVERPAPISSERPVAVLFGPRTGSSGEAVVIAFRGRPQTHSFGQPSAGFATSNDTFPLSDGAVLNLTTNRIADRTGTVQNQQLRPDTSVPTRASGQQDPAINAARSWLADQCRSPR